MRVTCSPWCHSSRTEASERENSAGRRCLPDEGPRDSRWHKHIVNIEPIANTCDGNWVLLECGHGITTFGDLAPARGVILCTKWRDLAEQ
jgi:hypothetical protein